jgi:hypothetical protein
METQREQLERKAQQARTPLTETLEELRAGMTPGQVVDQLGDYAREECRQEAIAKKSMVLVRH